MCVCVCVWARLALPLDQWFWTNCVSTEWMWRKLTLDSQVHVQGRSDKYLAYKRKGKFWKSGDLFLNSLLLPRYTWPTDAPTFLNHLKNTFNRDLQSRPPWRRWTLHSTLSAGDWLFQVWKQNKSRTGPKLWEYGGCIVIV